MQIDEVAQILEGFVARNHDLIGTVACAASPAADPSVFPNEVEKLQHFTRGIYLLHRKADGQLLYVGVSSNIIGRIYRHIGTNVSYAREGAPCRFPNFRLTQWEGFSQALRDTCQNGQFFVTPVAVEPFEAAKLLESLILYHGHLRNEKPPLNISF